jgi:hypothetical protein
MTAGVPPKADMASTARRESILMMHLLSAPRSPGWGSQRSLLAGVLEQVGQGSLDCSHLDDEGNVEGERFALGVAAELDPVGVAGRHGVLLVARGRNPTRGGTAGTQFREGAALGWGGQ